MDQRGSSVLRGNLLIIPINDSLLYVEPLYLQSEQSKMPELRRVIVASGDKIVMEPTLDQALQRIFGEGVGQVPGTTPTPGTQEPTAEQPTDPVTPTAQSIKELAEEANRLYNEAQNRLRSGDWAGYGQSLDQLQNVINRLQEQAE
ncbi:hypothetical protein N752_13825 [Desulforamulus aquiferis]|nr:hypothetical protein N752_13825 [Desulforamulus aquiferis]